MNRVEATVAHMKPVAPTVAAASSVDVAVELLETAITAQKRHTASLQTMMLDIRRGR